MALRILCLTPKAGRRLQIPAIWLSICYLGYFIHFIRYDTALQPIYWKVEHIIQDFLGQNNPKSTMVYIPMPRRAQLIHIKNFV